jgi:hypothetical protein
MPGRIPSVGFSAAFSGIRLSSVKNLQEDAAIKENDLNREARAMPKSKAENYKEVIMSSVEEETEAQAIADAAKASARIYVERVVRPEELSKLVEKALDGTGDSFRLKFDDDSTLYLSTREGILTATVSK